MRLHSFVAAAAFAAGMIAATPLRAGARGQCLQLVGLYRSDGARAASPRRPASRCATTPSTPTRRWRPSCSPASPATTWWCRPPISSSARSRPACSRSSTRASCRTSSNVWPEIAKRLASLRSRQPVRRQLHVGHHRHRLQRQGRARTPGRERQDRQLGRRVQAGDARQVQGLRRPHARFLRRHPAGGAALSRPRSEFDQAEADLERRPTC